jgi:hypothetical protein
MRELLGDDVIHLTIVQLPVAWSDPELVTVRLTGLPPALCAPLWSATDRNPRITEFVRATTHASLFDIR